MSTSHSVTVVSFTHILFRRTFEGTWGSYWFAAFEVNTDDTVTIWTYRNGTTANQSNFNRIVNSPIGTDHNWAVVGNGSRDNARKMYANLLKDGYKPVPTKE